MRFLHIADLHIGKRVNEFNMAEDQKFILEQILSIVEKEKTDAILIAGDVYDKSQPSTEAVEILDDFLTKLIAQGQTVFVISGNHDSPERLGFGSRIMQKNGLHIAGVFGGKLQVESLQDEYGKVNIYLLPYLKPSVTQPYFEQKIESYEDAVKAVISETVIENSHRNVLLAHQFVTSGTHQPERSDSESISVGGMDNVDAAIFDMFDYVALGHIHGPQKIGQDTIRYAGSPLKYSFSEARHHKSITLLNLGAKGSVNIQPIFLSPLHDMREIKGPIAELLRIGRIDTEPSEDYIHATLTDEEEIYDAIGQLRQVYPNLMALDFENSRNSQAALFQSGKSGDITQKSPIQLFSEFYFLQNNNDLSEEQLCVMEQIFNQVGGYGV